VSLAAALGLVAGRTLGGSIADARAQEPAAEDGSAEQPPAEPVADAILAAPADGPRLVCQVFAVDVRHPTPLDTADGTTEVGQWVAARAAEGLVLYAVDFEVGQKPTGYPQGYVQVCVYPGAA
jgi:hypothetical protein